MAEYDHTRLYWIKLTDKFMTSDTVDFLMAQKDGANYIVLYQMLCLKTINNNGELARELGEIIVPYDEEKIQRDTKYFSIDTIRIALELYKKLGMIYLNQKGFLQITDFDRLIGSTTKSAEKKQIQLKKRADILIGGKVGGKKVENFPPDIDKEIDIDNIYNTHRACAREKSDFEERFKAFTERHPQIMVNNYTGAINEIDLDRLSAEIEQSEFLKQQTSFYWLCKQWHKIKEGYYRDMKPKKNENSTMDILADLYYEEQEKKKNGKM